VNRSKKGREFELMASSRLHREGVPLLISPQFLRQMGLGQIDIARIKNEVIEIYELKHSSYISPRQKGRIKSTAHFLGQLLGKPAFTRLFVKR